MSASAIIDQLEIISITNSFNRYNPFCASNRSHVSAHLWIIFRRFPELLENLLITEIFVKSLVLIFRNVGNRRNASEIFGSSLNIRYM